jgi:hypothetical protein
MLKRARPTHWMRGQLPPRPDWAWSGYALTDHAVIYTSSTMSGRPPCPVAARGGAHRRRQERVAPYFAGVGLCPMEIVTFTVLMTSMPIIRTYTLPNFFVLIRSGMASNSV